MPTFELFKLIGDKPRTAHEVVAKALAALQALDAGLRDRALERALEAVSKALAAMKLWLYGDEGHEPTRANVVALADEAVRTDLLAELPAKLALLDFEARKDAAQVFGAIVRIRDADDRCPGAAYVEQHFDVVEALFDGYADPAVALNCGSMLRDCIRDEGVARKALASAVLWDFFDQVEVANFEVASDAFSTFKDLLTRHKGAVAAFLSDSYAEFFEHFHRLLQSANYVTRRQSLKLLGELLLDGVNVRLMMRYVSDVRNLMLMMNLLKDSSRSIQFEAFHVFKVFVANPSKPQPVVDILTNNRGKLLKYLEDFLPERDEDEQFKEEKAVIIKEISKLGRSDGGSSSASDAAPPGAQPSAAAGEQPPAAAAAVAQSQPPPQQQPQEPAQAGGVQQQQTEQQQQQQQQQEEGLQEQQQQQQ